MKTLILALPSRHVVLGASLALMLQTNYRFIGPVGLGELLVFGLICLRIVGLKLSRHTLNVKKPDTLTGQYLTILCLIITPMTLVSSALNITGVSFRDLLSFYFVGAVLLLLPRSSRDVQAMILSFLIVAYTSIIFQYTLGGSGAYYFSRFSGGAKNPNQLGLYLIVSIVFLSYIPNIWTRLVVISLALFFGIAALSDAFLIAAFIGLVIFIALIFFPPRIVIYLLPFIIFLGYIGFLYTGLLEFFGGYWTKADEGGSRTTLYLSAIVAWASTPISIIFGYGAGSFSGLSGPFNGAEAHNTVLDLATVAGIFGLYLFPFRPFLMAMRSLSIGLRFVPAALVAMIVFGLFHFVGRQPVFWVALVLAARLLSNPSLAAQRPIDKIKFNEQAGQ